jgi:hypothetical protein
MPHIFDYIKSDDIIFLDRYEVRDIFHSLEGVKFRVNILSQDQDPYWATVPLGVYNDKAINITNHSLSFLIEKFHHFISDDYARVLQNNFETLKKDTEFIIVDEPVFQFFGYALLSGHMYDDLFYLLYIYKKFNIQAKLLAIKTDNWQYNILLELIKKYFDVEYFYINFNINYIFKQFYVSHMFQNVFFNEVKDFINLNLIDKVLYNFKDIKSYDTILKIKTLSNNKVYSTDNIYTISDTFTKFMEDNMIFNLNSVNDEEYKIYLLNNAKNIIITFGSIYYIYINYYCKEIINKNIIIISNTPSAEYHLRKLNNELLYQTIDIYDGGYKDQIYNNTILNGKVLYPIHNLDEVLVHLSNLSDK